MLGPGCTGPPNLAQAPQIFRVITVHKLLNTGQLDTVVLLVVVIFGGPGPSSFCLPNDEGPGPQIFFPRTAPDRENEAVFSRSSVFASLKMCPGVGPSRFLT